MIGKNNKKIWLVLCLLLFLFSWLFAQADGLFAPKELTNQESQHVNKWVKFLWSDSWVWTDYYLAHEDLSFWERWAAWILEVDDIMDYLVLVVKFLSQLWLLVGVIFIIYAWYQYMLSVFKNSWTPSRTLKNAIIWVLIVIFSYAIMKILTSFIGQS
jgi:hypothetical protein